MDNIYIVVEFNEGFYDTDKDSARILAVSDNLEQLFEHFHGAGDLLTIDRTVYNTNLYLNIDDSIVSQPGVSVRNYVNARKEYTDQQRKNKKNSI